MIGHHNVHYIFGSPPLHVAANTFRGLRMASRGNSGIECGRVALPANIGVVSHGLNAALHPVRIVARGTPHFAVAFQKALRLAESVSGAVDDFEFVVMAGTGCMIEHQQKVRK